MDLCVRANLADWAGKALLFGSVGRDKPITPSFENNKAHLLRECLKVVDGSSKFGRQVSEVESWGKP